MRMKSKDISIENLNPAFTVPLQKLDLLHKQLMGNQAVVTSVDTGKHWGSIKKENRPKTWGRMNEMEVRQYSDSKHYDTPCDALDFRRRCPDGKLTYFDDLTQSQQEYFRAEIYECFPDHIFDVVFSRLCIHVEHDPDFDVRKPRGLTNEDIKQDAEDLKRDGETMNNIKSRLKKKETPIKLPIYKRSGFKRKLGGLLLAVGGILTLIPQTSIIGQGILAIGGAMETLGLGAGLMKNRKKPEDTKIDTMAILRIIADILIKLFGKKEKKNG